MASVAKNTKIRILEEHAKRQAHDMAIATWDSNLGKKEVIAERKRNEEGELEWFEYPISFNFCLILTQLYEQKKN